MAALHEVLHFDRVWLWPEIRRYAVLELGFGDLVLQVKTLAHLQQLILGHLLELVCAVAAFEAFAEGPALDGLAQDHGRAIGFFDRCLVGGMYLHVVVATAWEVSQVFVA